MSSYYVPANLRDIEPRPWGECVCQDCIAWISEDLARCTEKSHDSPNIEYICSRLSRWTVWITSEFTQIGLYYPVVSDFDTDKYLTSKNITNWWCPAINRLCPIKITGDGNCLPHAVSMYLWGMQDHSMTLRRQLYLTLLNSDPGLFRERWKREREWQNSLIPDGGLQYTKEEWNNEWSLLVTAAEDQRREFNSDHPSLPYESLEEIHIFVLANVLRRPIIILAEPEITSMVDGKSMGQNNFGGIYLPLLWPSKQCYKYPIVMSFLFNHFEPLVAEKPKICFDPRWHQGNVIPLVTSLQEMLHVHFTNSEEESAIHKVVQNYLYVNEAKVYLQGSTEVILVANLPQPEEVIMYKMSYQLRRPFGLTEINLLNIHKHLIYDRFGRNDTVTDLCWLYKIYQRAMNLTTKQASSSRERSTRKKRKMNALMQKQKWLEMLIRHYINPKPQFTIMTENELAELDKRLEEELDAKNLGSSHRSPGKAPRGTSGTHSGTCREVQLSEPDGWEDEYEEVNACSCAVHLLLLTMAPLTGSQSKSAGHSGRHAFLFSISSDALLDYLDGDTRLSIRDVRHRDIQSSDPGGDKLMEVDQQNNRSGLQTALYSSGESRISELNSRAKSVCSRPNCSKEGCNKPCVVDRIHCNTCTLKEGRIEEGAQSEFGDASQNDDMQPNRSRTKCSNEGCNKLSQDDSIYCKTCRTTFQDSTIINTTQQESSNVLHNLDLCSAAETISGRSKCSNEGCIKESQDDNAYCRTCAFQQSITETSSQPEASDSSLNNNLISIIQSLAPPDGPNWKQMTIGNEQRSPNNMDTKVSPMIPNSSTYGNVETNFNSASPVLNPEASPGYL